MLSGWRRFAGYDAGITNRPLKNAGHRVKYHEMHRRFAGSCRFCARTRSGAGATYQFWNPHASGAVTGQIASVVAGGFAQRIEIRHGNVAVVLDADNAFLAQLGHLPANCLDGEPKKIGDIGA